MKTKKILAAVAVLVCAVVASVIGVFAYYQGTKTLTQTNTITIGTKVTTITLGSDTDESTEIYPDDSITYEYVVKIDNYDKTGNVTVSAVLDDTSKDDFEVKVEVYSSGSQTAKTGDSAYVVVTGDTVKVQATMKSTIETAPTYTKATLTVTLTEPDE